MKRTLTAGLILIFLMGSAFAQDKPKVEGEIKGRIRSAYSDCQYYTLGISSLSPCAN